MKNIILLIIAVLAGIVAGIWLVRREKKNMGVVDVDQEELEEKEKRKERILKFLEMRGKTNNDEVQGLLHVPNISAEKYLSELEEEGKIKQVIGRAGVEYEINS